MNKVIILLLVITVLVSCKNAKKNDDEIQVAKRFYEALDTSDSSLAMELIANDFKTIDDGFEQKYTGKEYAEWVKWDSVFKPVYVVLKMERVDGSVRTTVSKKDHRISFLHDEPIITNEIIRFRNKKIMSIDRSSASFNVERFLENRDKLVRWIEENHPELDGFLYDQTQNGAMNYMKSIELYRKKSSELR